MEPRIQSSSAIAAGAGFFVGPRVAVGADLGITILRDGLTITLFTLAPFAKFVTGRAEHRNGFFAEPSVGLTLAKQSSTADAQTLLQLTAWVGGHFPLGQSSLAVLAGPYVSRLRNLSTVFGDADTFFVGFRFGLSAYLP